MSFFLRYLIGSRVFPEPEYERPIKRALEIVELARIQLPNSWKLGRALPDAFSNGCKGMWSSMQTAWVFPTDTLKDEDGTDEPETKRQKLNHPEDAESTSSEKLVEVDEEITTEPTTPVGGGWGTSAPAGEDMGGWGAAENSWGDTTAFATTEGDEPTEELAPPIWDASIDPQATWDIEVPTLLPLLGPSAFPLTHTTGIVEQSTRRIVRVEPPRAPRALAQSAPAAEAVEEDLGCRFARLVLAPWERLDRRTYEAGSDVLPPTILSTSRGTVVMEDDGEEEEEEEEEEGGSGSGDGESPSVVKAHRPWKDEIAVLVDPKLTDILIAGMGIGAIWVEIVRDQDAEGHYAASASKKGKGKKKEVPKHWYMEQVVHQLPSFHIDKPEEA